LTYWPSVVAVAVELVATLVSPVVVVEELRF
jgi:hypothetical protein